MSINPTWHKANRMPPKATLDQRVNWHLEHKKACASRDIPPKLQAEINKRSLA